MRQFTNPESFVARFAAHFTLGLSACLVVVLILRLVGRLDVPMAALWSFGFSALFGVIRAVLSRPGSGFWGSPLTRPRARPDSRVRTDEAGDGGAGHQGPPVR